MEIILRTIGIYLFLLVLFRLLGKRSLSELSAFDFILFLIISEALQNALVHEDKSVVMGLTVVLTFLMLDLGLSYLKRKYTGFEKIAEGVPLLQPRCPKMGDEAGPGQHGTTRHHEHSSAHTE